MGKPRYDHPTPTFPYKISRRLNMMSGPKHHYVETDENMPPLSEMGVRRSALQGKASDRVNEAAYPYIRRLLLLKRMYKNRFSQERMERIERMIEAANVTIYTKLANAAIDLRKGDKNTKDIKKKRGWSESDWKKHMDYISQIAGPKKVPEPEPIQRGEIASLEDILPRLRVLAQMPEFKVYKRLSQEDWYRDPRKVAPNALKYIISDRTKKLAAHRIIMQ